MLNKIVLMGRLTRDPEMRQTQNGTSVTAFTLACERDFKDKATGEKETDFIDIVAWRNTADFVCKYFSKGRMAVVEGRLQIRFWNDRDGNKRKATEVIADSVYFGDSKKDGDGGHQQNSHGGGYDGGYGGAPSGRSAASASAPPNIYPPSDYADFSDIDDDSGDLPF